MKSEPRTVELSRSNFDAAVEAFLRATDKIKDSETPDTMNYIFRNNGLVSIKITFTQAQENRQSTDHVVLQTQHAQMATAL